MSDQPFYVFDAKTRHKLERKVDTCREDLKTAEEALQRDIALEKFQSFIDALKVNAKQIFLLESTLEIANEWPIDSLSRHDLVLIYDNDLHYQMLRQRYVATTDPDEMGWNKVSLHYDGEPDIDDSGNITREYNGLSYKKKPIDDIKQLQIHMIDLDLDPGACYLEDSWENGTKFEIGQFTKSDFALLTHKETWKMILSEIMKKAPS